MFALDPVALRDAADRLSATAGVLGCLDVASPFAAVAAELPGSAAAGGCDWVATRLAAALDCWESRLADLWETARWVAGDTTQTDLDTAGRYPAPAPR